MVCIFPLITFALMNMRFVPLMGGKLLPGACPNLQVQAEGRGMVPPQSLLTVLSPCVLGAYSLPCAEFNVCIGSKVVNYISKEICAIHGSFAYLLASFIHLNFASLWGRDVLGNLKLDINVGW